MYLWFIVLAFGVLLGAAVQALLACGLMFYAMPAVSLGLLDVAALLTWSYRSD